MSSVATSPLLPSFRWYRGLPGLVALLVALAGVAAASVPPPTSELLDEAEGLFERHRYREAVELLGTLEVDGLAVEERCSVQRAMGRASFHLGRYGRSYELLHQAAASGCEDDRLASVYLNAGAYLTGRRAEALAGLERALQAGVRDLYLDVTMPGERGFLGDPQVWEVLERHARALAIPIGAGAGSGTGIVLGLSRDGVDAVAPAGTRWEGPTAVLVVGPHRALELELDEGGALARISVDADALLRYSPYRLDLGDGLGWRSAPDEAVERLGAPSSFEPLPSGGVRMRWLLGGSAVALEFGSPGPARPAPVPSGRAILRRLELRR